MKAIWKFPLAVMDSQTVEMPSHAQSLCVQIQGSMPCLWAIVSQDAPKVQRTVRMYGTGHPAPDDLSKADYVGTFQLSDGALVFHVFIY